MKELCELYTEINALFDISKMVGDGNLKSESAKAFNAGTSYALRSVLELIKNKVEDYEEREENE